MCSTLVGSCPCAKILTKVEVNGSGKHSSLLRQVNKYFSETASKAPERCLTRIGSDLHANIRLGWKGLKETNTLAVYGNS
jgi:hypothetical protein